MTQAQTMRVAGFRALARVRGSELRHSSGAQFSAIVDRTPQSADFELAPESRDVAEIHILRSDLKGQEIKTGSTFTDPDGVTYTVSSIKPSDIKAIFVCSVDPQEY